MAGYEEIIDHVLKNKGQVFFVDGPGGTGKTYLYKALIAKVRSMDFIAVATATYGIIEIFSHKFLIGPFASVIGGQPQFELLGAAPFELLVALKHEKSLELLISNT